MDDSSVPILLTPDDPDYASYNTGDPTFLLNAVGETIRQYCNWHIAPSLTVTVGNIEVGSSGIIMLPSLYVTDVASVVIQASPACDPITLDPDSYVWDQRGYIQAQRPGFHGSVSGYWYEPGPVFLPIQSAGIATVTFTHGYTELPPNVKWVAYELAGWTEALGPNSAAGDIKEIKSQGFALQLGGAVSLGMNLNPDQKNRLAPYNIRSPK